MTVSMLHSSWSDGSGPLSALLFIVTFVPLFA